MRMPEMPRDGGHEWVTTKTKLPYKHTGNCTQRRTSKSRDSEGTWGRGNQRHQRLALPYSGGPPVQKVRGTIGFAALLGETILSPISMKF